MRLPPVFIDAAGWIEAMTPSPTRALVLASSRGESGLGSVHTSDYVVLETYSWLLQRRRRPSALAFLEHVRSPRLVLHASDPDLVDRAMDRARERPLKRELSLVDWTSALLMQDHGIEHVLTTDRGFAQLGFTVLP